MLQHVAQIRRPRAQIGVHRAQNRLLAQVVADKIRNVGIHRLVVGHAVADRVGQRHVARPVGAHQPRNSHQRVAAEDQGVQEVVVHPAVDHVHPPQPADGLHVHHVVVHDQVAAFHQLDAHLLGQKAVLKVRAVVAARRQQHRLGRRAAPRRQALQNPAQLRRVVVHREHPVGLEGLRQRPRHNQPVFQNVGNPARRPHVVFQHHVLARLRVADQVDPADVGKDPARHLQPHHLAPEVLAGVHQRARNAPVRQDLLLPVNVGQKQVQRHHPLRQAPLDPLPLRVRHNPRNQVKREELLRPRFVAIHRKRNALQQKGKVGNLAPLVVLLRRHLRQGLEKLGVVRPRHARSRKHLVVESTRVVALKQPA